MGLLPAGGREQLPSSLVRARHRFGGSRVRRRDNLPRGILAFDHADVKEHSGAEQGGEKTPAVAGVKGGSLRKRDTTAVISSRRPARPAWRAETGNTSPELVGEVHEQDGVLDFHADEGDEADGAGERERVTGEPQPGHAAAEAERDDGGDDEGAAEAFELEDENGEDAKRGHQEHIAEAAEAFGLALDLAGEGPANPGRPFEGAMSPATAAVTLPTLKPARTQEVTMLERSRLKRSMMGGTEMNSRRAIWSMGT